MLELRLEIYNGVTIKAATRKVLVSPIKERINFGFEVATFEFNTSDLYTNSNNEPDVEIGYRADLFVYDGTNDTKVFGGIIYSNETDHRGITTIKCESHSHGLTARNPWNKLGANTEDKSLIYAYNNTNILRLAPAGGLTFTSILMNGVSELQTLGQALEEYCFETNTFFRIDPDGNLYATAFPTTNATMIPNNVLVDASQLEDFDAIINRGADFRRSLKSGDQSDNGSQVIGTTGDLTLGSFTPTEDYWIAGVSFFIDTPSSSDFDLYLSTTTSSGSAIFSTFDRNLQNSRDHDLAQLPVTKNISGITLTSGSPVSVTVTSHGFTTGETVYFENVGGTTELNNQNYVLTVVDANTFTLDGTDGDNFSAWTNGGYCWVDYLYQRTLMFDEIIKVESGTAYYWIARYDTATGNAPLNKFGNVFNYGSKTKESDRSFDYTSLENQNTSTRSTQFTLLMNSETLAYDIGDFVSLNNLGRDEFETPAHIVERELDFNRGTINFKAGVRQETIADKIKKLSSSSLTSGGNVFVGGGGGAGGNEWDAGWYAMNGATQVGYFYRDATNDVWLKNLVGNETGLENNTGFQIYLNSSNEFILGKAKSSGEYILWNGTTNLADFYQDGSNGAWIRSLDASIQETGFENAGGFQIFLNSSNEWITGNQKNSGAYYLWNGTTNIGRMYQDGANGIWIKSDNVSYNEIGFENQSGTQIYLNSSGEWILGDQKNSGAVIIWNGTTEIGKLYRDVSNNVWLKQSVNGDQIGLENQNGTKIYLSDVDDFFYVGDVSSSGRGIFSGGMVINEGGGSATTSDFRVESDTNPNGIFLDASLNKIGFFTSTLTPAIFNVSGTAYFSSSIEIDGDFNHDGSNVGFYGKAPVGRQSVAALPGGATTADNTNKINEILDALGTITGVGLILKT